MVINAFNSIIKGKKLTFPYLSIESIPNSVQGPTRGIYSIKSDIVNPFRCGICAVQEAEGSNYPPYSIHHGLYQHFLESTVSSFPI